MASRKEHQRRREIIRQMRQVERLTQAAYVEQLANRRWFFVIRLDPQQFINADGHQYEVQVLDQDGRGVAVGYFTDPDVTLTIAQQVIPTAVLHAALRQPAGQGDYVNEAGESIPAW